MNNIGALITILVGVGLIGLIFAIIRTIVL